MASTGFVNHDLVRATLQHMTWGADPGHDLAEIAPEIWTNGHLHFEPDGRGWAVRLSSAPNGAPLGRVAWLGFWQCYTFRAELVGYPLAAECLADISTFCRDRTAEDLAALAERVVEALGEQVYPSAT